MLATGADTATGRPLEELVQTVSEQAVVLAREEVDLARRERTVESVKSIKKPRAMPQRTGRAKSARAKRPTASTS
jgi:hypothetical protein